MTRIAVVGAGISGLVAAYRLRTALGPEAEIVVVESGARIGGKLRTVATSTGPLDMGAEAFIARRPEVPSLLAELGLSEQLVQPSSASPLILSGGQLHPLPARTVMGIPSSAESVAGLVDTDTTAKVRAERARPFEWVPGDDISVGDLVRDRFGAQVVARSVDPLLGGVYSGSADSIGVRAAIPTLAAALDSGAASLTEAVAAALPAPSQAPVFGGLRDGYGILLDALRAAAAVDLVLDIAVTSLRPSGRGWDVDPIGAVDAVVMSAPAPDAAHLLGDRIEALRSIQVAGSVVAALVFEGVSLPANSGVLVATGELGAHGLPLEAKAFTLSSRKWPHLAERGRAIVRASFGRLGDEAVVHRTDQQIVAAARRDLASVLGIDAEPSEAIVQRWFGGLPQYAPHHTELVAEIERAVADLPGLELTGAYLHGVGVPACVAAAGAAVERLMGTLAVR